RHYIQYLFYKRLVEPEVYGWLMEVVPSRTYKLDVRPYQISLEDVRRTLDYLGKHHELYYVLYRLMLESGARLEHAIKLLSSWAPNALVEVPGLDIETKRLVCFNDFCRYYMGLRETGKPCEWVYFSLETLRFIEKLVPLKVSRHSLRKYANRHNLLLPKMMRKVAWRLMVKSMPREVARFIQSRFGELKISEARYEDLLSEADEHYPKYLEKLRNVLGEEQEKGKKS
ncbi:MAG: integrase, partial [Desulfurococcaceae archaeon]